MMLNNIDYIHIKYIEAENIAQIFGVIKARLHNVEQLQIIG